MTATKPKKTGFALLISTAKGGFVLEAVTGRSRWPLRGPVFLGSKVHDFRIDPRDGRTLLLTATGGHLGPTVYRSRDRGRTFEEAKRPPAFKRASKKSKTKGTSRGRTVDINFWLEPGHADEPDVWYCGTSPQGLFRSTDAGETWKGVKGFNENPMWFDWTGRDQGKVPDGAFLHSIAVDPRDKKHMYVSLSLGGTFESLDQGKSWTPLNAGVDAEFLPEPGADYGHDTHCMVIHPGNPDILYQQNHCGIYRLNRKRSTKWDRIGRTMPKSVGDIGFNMVPHPTDPDDVWVFPMDGTKAWPRTSPGARPAVYRTLNAGRTWRRCSKGLPEKQAWFSVKRQAMTCDGDEERPGLYFGTTSGEIWYGRDGGESFRRLVSHLPHIYAVRAARFA